MKNKIVGLLFGIGWLTLPLFVFGATFPGPFPVLKSVNLKLGLQVNGQPVKSPAIVGAGKDFSVVWSSAEGARCMSNWNDSSLEAKGASVGSITASRAFVVTCFAPGAAQTASVQVVVGTTDLSVVSLSATGFKSAKKKGVYTAGHYVLKASVRNSGKLGTPVPFRVRFEESADGKAGWVASGEEVIPPLRGGGTAKIPELQRTGNAGTEPRYYRVCVDTERKVEESNEGNNCSKVIGPYSFVTPAPSGDAQ